MGNFEIAKAGDQGAAKDSGDSRAILSEEAILPVQDGPDQTLDRSPEPSAQGDGPLAEAQQRFMEGSQEFRDVAFLALLEIDPQLRESVKMADEDFASAVKAVEEELPELLPKVEAARIEMTPLDRALKEELRRLPEDERDSVRETLYRYHSGGTPEERQAVLEELSQYPQVQQAARALDEAFRKHEPSVRRAHEIQENFEDASVDVIALRFGHASMFMTAGRPEQGQVLMREAMGKMAEIGEIMQRQMEKQGNERFPGIRDAMFTPAQSEGEGLLQQKDPSGLDLDKTRARRRFKEGLDIFHTRTGEALTEQEPSIHSSIEVADLELETAKTAISEELPGLKATMEEASVEIEPVSKSLREQMREVPWGERPQVMESLNRYFGARSPAEQETALAELGGYGEIQASARELHGLFTKHKPTMDRIAEIQDGYQAALMSSLRMRGGLAEMLSASNQPERARQVAEEIRRIRQEELGEEPEKPAFDPNNVEV